MAQGKHITKNGDEDALKDRERIMIGHIFDVPPIQLTEEQVQDYKKKL